MSGPTHADKSRAWLGEQLDQLGALANAGPRDATFKAWRQSTLTVVQRVWPYDATRQDRFRRIRFTSPEPKADARKLKEWFARASDDAAQLLRQWIAEIEQHGVPEPQRDPTPQAASTSVEDDVPTLDLHAGGAGRGANGIVAREEIMLDLGGPSTAAASGSEGKNVRDPAPPTLHVKVPDKLAALRKSVAAAAAAAPKAKAAPPAPAKPEATRGPAKSEAPAAPPKPVAPAASSQPHPEPSAAPAKPAPPAAPARPAAPAAPVQPVASAAPPTPEPPPAPAAAAPPQPAPDSPAPARPVVVEKPAGIGQSGTPLGDLLGLRDVVKRAQEPEAPAPEVPAPPPVAAAAPAPEPAPPPPPVATAAPAPEPVAPPPPEPAPPPPPVAAAAPEPAVPLPPAEAAEAGTGEPAASRSSFGPDELAGPEDDGPDSAAFEIAAMTFMTTSPVLSAQGRPVQRVHDTPEFEHPDAIAITTLAGDAVKLGVPEGQRATARALLVDLARALEDGDPSWETLRDAVSWTMNHPELARRLLPVLLPWLDRAA